MPTQDARTQGKKNADKLEARFDEIKKLRGGVRGEIDLAEGEVRKGFRAIEPAVDKAEHELTRMAGNATEAVARTADSLANSLRKIRSRAKTKK